MSATGPDDEIPGSDWVIGVAFSFASSVLSCLGLIFQKYAHNQNQALPDDKKYPVVAGIVCSPCWWASFIMMGLFPFPFDFFAYSFAAQSLVAPFAGLTLIMNQFFAPLILKEKLYRIDVIASIIVFTGTTITTATGNHEDEEYTLDDLLEYFRRPEFVVGASLLAVLMALMLSSLLSTDPRRAASPSESRTEPEPAGEAAMAEAGAENSAADGPKSSSESQVVLEMTQEQHGQQQGHRQDPESKQHAAGASAGAGTMATAATAANATESLSFCRKLEWANFAARPFYYGFVSGGFGAFQNIFFKATGVLMKTSVFNDGPSAWRSGWPYLFIVLALLFATLQLSVLNYGMSRYDAVLVFPLYNASFIFLSVSMGALFYGEFALFTSMQWVLYPVGVVITLLGIITFIFKPRENSEEGPAPGAKAKEREPPLADNDTTTTQSTTAPAPDAVTLA